MSPLPHLTALEASGLIRLIAAHPELEYGFRHVLVQDAAYESLLKQDRRQLHRVIGETIEALYPERRDELAPRLGHHFYEAGDQRAIDYYTRAGKAAARQYANAEAVAHYSLALDAARRAGTPAPAVHRARGRVYEALGDFERSRADHEAALQQTQASGDRKGEWQALLDLGMLWASRDYSRTGEYFGRALALARELGDPLALARSLNRMGNWQLNVDEPMEALGYHREALSVFERSHDPRGLAETLDLLGMTSYLGGDLLQGTEYYRRATGLFRQVDDRLGLISALATVTMQAPTYQTDTMATATASLPEALQYSEQALEIARKIGHRSGEAYSLFVMSICLGSQGKYSRGLACAEASFFIAEDIQHRQWMTAGQVCLGALHVDLMAFDEGRRRLEDALAMAREIASKHWVGVTSGLLAQACIGQGDFLRAQSVLDDVLPPNAPHRSLSQRMAWCAMAQLALAQGGAERALEIAQRLAAAAPHAEQYPPIRVGLIRGEALIALGRASEAESVLAALRERAEAQGARPMLWRILAALARAHEAGGRREDARRAADSARALIEELAAEVPEPDLRDNFLRAAQTRVPTFSAQPA